MTGKLVQKGWVLSHEINISTLNSGIYMLSIQAYKSQNWNTIKVVKGN